MNLPQRKSPRRKKYDYDSPNTYFVTICTCNRIHYFWEVVGAGLALTDIGNICDYEIHHMIKLREDVEMCTYTIMPNHIHVLFSFGSMTKNLYNNQSVDASIDPTQGFINSSKNLYHNQTLSSIIWSFKSAVTRECNKKWLKSEWLWFVRQISFHDHIVRNQQEFDQIEYYIQTNIENRENDKFNW